MFKVNNKDTRTKPTDVGVVSFGVNQTAKIFKEPQKVKLKQN